MSSDGDNHMSCDDLERMAAYLRELGHHDAALRTSEVIALHRELSDVWDAAAFAEKTFWAEAQLADVLEEWRAKRTVSAERTALATLVGEIEAGAVRLRAALAAVEGTEAR